MSDSSAKEVTQRRQSYTLPNGRTVFLAPLVLRDISTIEQECLRRYKKTYMQSVTDCLDMLPESMRESKLADAWEKMLAMTNADLPKSTMETYVPLPNGKFKRDAAGKLVKEPRKLAYEEWWVSFSNEGKAFSTWISIRKEQPDITLELVESIIVQAPEAFDELADIVGELTKPTLGNESSSVPEQSEQAAV